MKNKLRRMLKTTENEPTASPSTNEAQKTTAEQTAWLDRGADILTFEDEWIVRLDHRYALEEKHGHRSYAEVFESLQLPHPPLALDVPLEQVIFFDTETTGLKGTGTTIFLLGFARFEKGQLLMRQYFLPHPHYEAALYHHFLHDIGEDVRFITYNGKSFDWPQIKTRHVFVRERVPRLPKVGHLDLLHVCRRMFKGLYDSFRLTAMEERIGFERTDDLPGFLAPMHYFQYVEHQNPAIMEGVLEHHLHDCLTLVSLYDECNRLVTHRQEAPSRVRENIGIWLADLGIHEQSAEHFGQADELTAEGWLRQGRLYKKLQQHEKANTCFEKSDTYEGFIELAKWAEHIAKQPSVAYDYTERAKRLLENRQLLASRRERLFAELNHRSLRLQRKCRE
ncbi:MULTISPECIES: ribonuclease H-like domain-containing protein [Exiguobacterium]|uniref:ribonuclease H-like domain-containing protein n=1 Tax=Exiguobacterium TaxID=33986 RepID=UPI001BE5A644|nr:MULTISPECIES: ribonuclease H-like domain-containing protein [Exiguobacterium]MCT4790754.1 ribonuclease H-like domain-containing protein [Exiguobacterium artemiae]